MPRVFKPVDITKEEKEVRKSYFGRHTPFIICDDSVKRGEKLHVKIKMGDNYPHPDNHNHYISTIQLWNRETLLATATFASGAMANQKCQLEVDFFVIPKVSMNLTAMAVCTNHGLWKSAKKFVKVID
ncbi:MAG: hypothetical protein JXA53_01460 [Bacteroidales bacterium]|nr:hypothetical protein [Bacteroidales bacterium]